MKKILFFIVFVLSCHFFSLAAPKKAWTWRTVASSGCYERYICDVRTTQPVCVKGTQTGWICVCAPWNCHLWNN